MRGGPQRCTADAGGVLEFVEDGVNGFVCPPDSPKEIGAKFDLIYRDRDRARAMGLAGQGRVREVTWDRVVERLTG